MGAYNATTGAPINANLIQGLSYPTGLAVSGNALFVANSGGAVGAYNAATGAPINASLIGVKGGPYGLTVPVPAPVPEASPWWTMAGCGAALLGIMLRKKYRSP